MIFVGEDGDLMTLELYMRPTLRDGTGQACRSKIKNFCR